MDSSLWRGENDTKRIIINIIRLLHRSVKHLTLTMMNFWSHLNNNGLIAMLDKLFFLFCICMHILMTEIPCFHDLNSFLLFSFLCRFSPFYLYFSCSNAMVRHGHRWNVNKISVFRTKRHHTRWTWSRSRNIT